MRVYNTLEGIILESDNQYFQIHESWDKFINNDNLYNTLQGIAQSSIPIDWNFQSAKILAPIGQQELWACGVTYLKSKVGRQEESKDAGGGDFYARVYDAVRPEVFFKATPNRISAPGSPVNIRKDSTWDVPEPELTLMVTSSGKIIGYTIGNDMSSRSIEGENPLYLPQAKTYDGCASVGPCIYITDKPLDPATQIHLEIFRGGKLVFDESIAISQMKRSVQELVSFVYRACSFPNGCLIMTGTGIVPPSDFTLNKNDEVAITIDSIGTLRNPVE